MGSQAKSLKTIEDYILRSLVPNPGDVNDLSPGFQIIHNQSETGCVNLRKTGECLVRLSLARQNRRVGIIVFQTSTK